MTIAVKTWADAVRRPSLSLCATAAFVSVAAFPAIAELSVGSSVIGPNVISPLTPSSRVDMRTTSVVLSRAMAARTEDLALNVPASGSVDHSIPDSPLAGLMTPFSHYGAGGRAGVDATAAFYGANPNPKTGLGHGGLVQDVTGPTVYLPSGEYDIAACPAATPYFSSAVTLVGAGRGRTVLKFTGTSCIGQLLAWGGGLSGYGVRDLTIDMNGAVAALPNPASPASVLVMTNNNHPVIEDVDILNTRGDHWFTIYAPGVSFGRLTRVRVQPSDCSVTWSQNLALYLSSSALAAQNVGSVSGQILTITTAGAYYPIVAGQAVIGTNIPAHEYLLPYGTSGTSGTGGAGTYAVTTPIYPPVASETVYTTSTHDWKLEDDHFVNAIPNFDAAYVETTDTEVGPWCGGTGMSTSALGTDWVSNNDTIHDGPQAVADILGVIDTGIESHGDRARFNNLRVFNVPSACVSYSGQNTEIWGGSCDRFNTFAINDGTATASVSGTTLTVTTVASGRVSRGQQIEGRSFSAPAIILAQAADNPTTCTPSRPCRYTLDKAPGAIAPEVITMEAFDSYAAVFASNGDRNGSASIVSNFTVRSSGTVGERYGFADNPASVGSHVQGMNISGVSLSPYHVIGGTVLTDLSAGMKVSQLAEIVPNHGTILNVIDATMPTYGRKLIGGGSAPALAVGTGTMFVAH